MTLTCRCGAVQMDVHGDASAQFYCHCDDCRAVTGGAFAPIALFASDAVAITTGNTFSWTYKTLPRTRCSTCGTLLFGEPPGLGMRGLSGFLLPTDRFKPTFHVHCGCALSPVIDALPHFKDLPAGFGGTDERIGW